MFTSRTSFRQFDELRRSCVRSPKRFTRHALGTVRRVRRTLRLIGWNLRALLWKRIKTGIGTYGWRLECFQPLASEELASFVDLSEGQRYYLWDPQIKTNKEVSAWHSRGVHCRGFQPRMAACVECEHVHACLCTACTTKFGPKPASY